MRTTTIILDVKPLKRYQTFTIKQQSNVEPTTGNVIRTKLWRTRNGHRKGWRNSPLARTYPKNILPIEESESETHRIEQNQRFSLVNFALRSLHGSFKKTAAWKPQCRLRVERHEESHHATKIGSYINILTVYIEGNGRMVIHWLRENA